MRWSLNGVEYSGSPEEAAQFAKSLTGQTALVAVASLDVSRPASTRKDSVDAFIRKCCQPDPMGEEPARALYVSYEKWCKSERLKALTENAFGRALTSMGYTVRRTNAGNLRTGLSMI